MYYDLLIILSDLFRFPFVAEVWGTASDWAMVIVTTLTLSALVSTLRSQLIIQRLQEKSTRINNELYRKQNKPAFTFGLEKKTHQNIKELKGITKVTYFEVSMLLNRYPAKNLSTSVDAAISKISSDTGCEKHFRTVKPGSKTSIRFRAAYHCDHLHSVRDHIVVEIQFEDPASNRYYQHFSITYTEETVKLDQYEPKLIEQIFT